MAEEVVNTPTREKEIELSYPKWLEKVTERCTLALLCIKDRTDKIQETDWEILRALHGVWYNGEVPLFKTITIPDTHQGTQATLFDTPVSQNISQSDNFDDARDKILDGTELVNVEVNQNNN
jgi:hypothetical protein